MSSSNFRTNSDIQLRSRIFSAFSKLSRGCQYLPRSYWIDPATITLPAEPHTYGRCAEVYHGRQNGGPVAVKILRVSNLENPEKIKKVRLRSAASETRGCVLTRRGVSVFVRRQSCGSTYRARTFSSLVAHFITMEYRQSSHLGWLMEISPNI